MSELLYFNYFSPMGRDIPESTVDGLIATDAQGRVCFVNSTGERLTGYAIDEMRGKPVSAFLTLCDEYSGQTVNDPVVASLASREVVTLGNHDVMVTREGEQVPVAGSASPLRDQQGGVVGVLLVLRDVTPTRLLMRRISYEAQERGRSGLLSRRQFQERVEHLLGRMSDIQEHALIIIQLSGLRTIDTHYGEGASKEVLNQLTERLVCEVREQDTLARLNEEEFAILLEHCPRRQAFWIGHRLQQAFSGYRFSCKGKDIALDVHVETFPIRGADHRHGKVSIWDIAATKDYHALAV